MGKSLFPASDHLWKRSRLLERCLVRERHAVGADSRGAPGLRCLLCRLERRWGGRYFGVVACPPQAPRPALHVPPAEWRARGAGLPPRSWGARRPGSAWTWRKGMGKAAGSGWALAPGGRWPGSQCFDPWPPAAPWAQRLRRPCVVKSRRRHVSSSSFFFFCSKTPGFHVRFRSVSLT